MKIEDIIKPAVIIRETGTYADALSTMLTEGTNTLLVVNAHGVLVGEVTVVDLLARLVPDTLDGSEVVEHFKNDAAFIASISIVKDLPVNEFMSLDFSPLTLNDDLATVIATAIAHERARIPVVDHDDHPIGIISRQGLKQILKKFMAVADE